MSTCACLCMCRCACLCMCRCASLCMCRCACVSQVLCVQKWNSISSHPPSSLPSISSFFSLIISLFLPLNTLSVSHPFSNPHSLSLSPFFHPSFLPNLVVVFARTNWTIQGSGVRSREAVCLWRGEVMSEKLTMLNLQSNSSWTGTHNWYHQPNTLPQHGTGEREH